MEYFETKEQAWSIQQPRNPNTLQNFFYKDAASPSLGIVTTARTANVTNTQFCMLSLESFPIYPWKLKVAATTTARLTRTDLCSTWVFLPLDANSKYGEADHALVESKCLVYSVSKLEAALAS